MNKVSVLEGADGSPPFWSDLRPHEALAKWGKYTKVFDGSLFKRIIPTTS